MPTRANLTIERRGRKGRKVIQCFSAAFALAKPQLARIAVERRLGFVPWAALATDILPDAELRDAVASVGRTPAPGHDDQPTRNSRNPQSKAIYSASSAVP